MIEPGRMVSVEGEEWFLFVFGPKLTDSEITS